ncbi:hypothetical protein KFE25_013908 [Diacronema lutheri]|uniref:Uncharacterized protein n=1 Tax=Diacronema lutheri TaxID=2081491 RepID=A0A8J6C6F0_DIALT|nr:hypothetical protein KFE25_013908 [Diacronema lutheri]
MAAIVLIGALGLDVPKAPSCASITRTIVGDPSCDVPAVGDAVRRCATRDHGGAGACERWEMVPRLYVRALAIETLHDPRCRNGCVDPPSAPLARCALVSSDNSLRGARCGDAIDAHDGVIRINLPTLRGFERDVGNRTTHIVVNHMIVREMMNGSRVVPGKPPRTLATAGLPVLMYRADWPNRLKRLPAAWARMDTSSLWVPPTDDERALRQWFDGALRPQLRPGARVPAPTKGLLALGFALSLCRSVSLFGFSDVNARFAYHYWEPSGTTPFSPARHNQRLEHALFDRLGDVAGWNATPVCQLPHGNDSSFLQRLYPPTGRGSSAATARGSRAPARPMVHALRPGQCAPAALARLPVERGAQVAAQLRAMCARNARIARMKAMTRLRAAGAGRVDGRLPSRRSAGALLGGHVTL